MTPKGYEPWPSPFPDHLVPIIRTHDWLGLADSDRCGDCFVRLDECTEPCAKADADEWHPCPDCGCQCSPSEWACWRCGAVQDDAEATR